jgi:hypothetical protein
MQVESGRNAGVSEIGAGFFSPDSSRSNQKILAVTELEQSAQLKARDRYIFLMDRDLS